MYSNNKQHALLRCHGNAFIIYYIIDIHVHMYVNNTNGTHCYASMTKRVRRTLHSVSYMYITHIPSR